MKIFLLLAIITFLFVPALAQKRLAVGSPAPAFSGTAMNGRQLSSSSLRGSVVVITFWSTRCEICRHEIPALNQLVDKFDAKKVAFLGLSNESEQRIAPYLKQNRFRFQIIPNSFGTLLEYADRARDGTIMMGYPAFYVIDQQGTLQYRASGYGSTPGVEAAINSLLR